MSTTAAVESAETQTITEPGLVHGMDDTAYHADPVPGGSLSSTFARLLTEHVPAKADALRRNRKPTKAMNLGKAAHRRALGAGPTLIVWQYDGRTNAGKAEREEHAAAIASEAEVAVTAEERDQIERMADALMAHGEVRDIFAASDAEVSGFWRENGVWCRARYDLLGASAKDYKSTQDVGQDAFSRTAARYGYHQQAEWYDRGLRALGHPAAGQPFQFICQETTEPYLVQIHEMDAEALMAARTLNDRALRVYAEAQRTGVWPGYPSLRPEHPTPLPFYYYTDREEDLGMVVSL